MTHRIIHTLFSESIAARMLRILLDAGEMTQAAFMTEYHRRCERARPSRSSFQHNFFDHYSHVITREPIASKRVTQRRLTRPDGTTFYYAGRNLLRWSGPSARDLVRNIPDEKLETYFAYFERAMQSPPRATDTHDDFAPWVVRLQAELERRANGGTVRDIPSVASAAGAGLNPSARPVAECHPFVIA